ncbi:ATP-dependent nuclease [Parageobacillus toebii]|jgi:putative ATP-dependent endonuclease of the OLD family|uniref:ATP-dependent nuclease n=1 Tax=Parageobacillus toebii TaxID=153151 RepID=UPI001967CEA5|nr:AAA family ATPase [Parageobacillus toebii]QSB48698.1 AAA family ATPase [Parageobacillus toebii]
MKFRKLIINNYRNLDGLTINLHPKLNFIVGENNLGKTNFLRMLNKIIYSRNFDLEDFNELDKPITVEITLELANEEVGVFEDYFSPQDDSSNLINIKVVQNSPEDNIEFFHLETEEKIHQGSFRKLNFINYTSLRNPINELNFSKGRGSGKFLKYLVQKYLEKYSKTTKDYLDEDKFLEVLKSLNETIKKIETFNQFSIKAHLEEEVSEILSKLIVLKGNEKFYMNELGYGVQYANLIPLVIIENIHSIIEKRNTHSTVYLENNDGEKYLPLIIGIDEPEIHLHPYMQKSIIKYLIEIAEGQENNFNELIKELFNLDKVDGQLIIVTHSPYVIQDDYRYIVRFYRDETGILNVKSGTEINFDEDIQKHLNKNMAMVKEAFYSRSVIIVEGETEQGAFPVFAQRMGIDLDKNGVAIVTADSVNNVPPLMKLFQEFGVKAIGVIDRDDGNESKEKFQGLKNLFITKSRNFEEEIVHAFNIVDYIKFMTENLNEKRSFIIGAAKKLKMKFNPANPKLYEEFEIMDESQLEDLKKEVFNGLVQQLKAIKGVIMGQEIAKYVTVIPTVYENAIKCSLGDE